MGAGQNGGHGKGSLLIGTLLFFCCLPRMEDIYFCCHSKKRGAAVPDRWPLVTTLGPFSLVAVRADIRSELSAQMQMLTLTLNKGQQHLRTLAVDAGWPCIKSVCSYFNPN